MITGHSRVHAWYASRTSLRGSDSSSTISLFLRSTILRGRRRIDSTYSKSSFLDPRADRADALATVGRRGSVTLPLLRAPATCKNKRPTPSRRFARHTPFSRHHLRQFRLGLLHQL